MRRPVAEALRRGDEVLRYARRGALARGAEKELRDPILRLDELRGRMDQAVSEGLREAGLEIRDRRAAWKIHHPALIMARRKDRLEALAKRLDQAAARRLEMAGDRLAHLQG